MSKRARRDRDDWDITVTVNARELIDAHTRLYADYGYRSADFPDGHEGYANCPCSIARALRTVEGMTEPDYRPASQPLMESKT